MNEYTAGVIGMGIIALVILVVIFRFPAGMTEFIRGITKVRWGLKGIEVQRDADAAAQRGGTRADVLEKLRAVPVRGLGLWVDDQPENNVAELRLLRGRGIEIDLAATNAGALALAQQAKKAGQPYQFVVSDIGRTNEKDPQGGLELPDLLEHGLGSRPTVIFYTGTAKETGIEDAVSTAIPAALFQAIADALKKRV